MPFKSWKRDKTAISDRDHALLQDGAGEVMSGETGK
jgi:hypothetical protein